MNGVNAGILPKRRDGNRLGAMKKLRNVLEEQNDDDVFSPFFCSSSSYLVADRIKNEWRLDIDLMTFLFRLQMQSILLTDGFQRLCQGYRPQTIPTKSPETLFQRFELNFHLDVQSDVTALKRHGSNVHTVDRLDRHRVNQIIERLQRNHIEIEIDAAVFVEQGSAN